MSVDNSIHRMRHSFRLYQHRQQIASQLLAERQRALHTASVDVNQTRQAMSAVAAAERSACRQSERARSVSQIQSDAETAQNNRHVLDALAVTLQMASRQRAIALERYLHCARQHRALQVKAASIEAKMRSAERLRSELAEDATEAELLEVRILIRQVDRKPGQ